MNTGRGQLADVQLTGNGGKGENIVVTVCHFVGYEGRIVQRKYVIPGSLQRKTDCFL